jgi:hypothetical protein
MTTNEAEALIDSTAKKAKGYRENTFYGKLFNGYYTLKSGKKVKLRSGYMVQCETYFSMYPMYLKVQFDYIGLANHIKSKKLAKQISRWNHSSVIYDLKNGVEISI